MKSKIMVWLAKWSVNGIILLGVFLNILYLMWRLFFTVPYEYGVFPTVASLLLFALEVVSVVETFSHIDTMRHARKYPLPEIPTNKYPHVDIFVSSYSEPVELLRKTLLACKRMDYPDKSKVHIYLCDDGRRDDMRQLAAEVGVNYLVRDTHEGAKAGNLNFALKHTSSPYIVTFDADMMPMRDFLLKTIPYFVDAKRKCRSLRGKDRFELGLLQTPQSFYDLDLYQFNLYSENRIPNEQDYFYRHIQQARTRTNSVVYGGSNTVLSRKALKATGGFFTGAITEDFATGILIEKKGFVSLGLVEPLASGVNPHTVEELIKQRVRWAWGVISTGRKIPILTSSELTFAQKVNYWLSVWNWYAPVRKLIYLLLPLLYPLFGIVVFKCTLFQIIVFWLPMYIFNRVSYRVIDGRARSTKWSDVYDTALFPFMLIPVLLETFGISLKKFKVTDKSSWVDNTSRPLYMIPFVLLIVLSIVGIVRGIQIAIAGSLWESLVLVFWMVHNLFQLIMALFFTSGRRAYHSSERVKIRIPGTLNVDGNEYECITSDISEYEISLDMERPYFFSDDLPVLIDIKSDRYYASLGLKFVKAFLVKAGDKNLYRYTFAITDYNDSYDDLLAILYDRKPEFMDEVASDGGIFTDLWLNIFHRLKPSRLKKERRPCILLDADISVDGIVKKLFRLYEFNYTELSVISSGKAPQELAFSIPSGDVVKCVYDSKKSGKLHTYRVINGEQLYSRQEDRDRIMSSLLELALRQGKSAARPSITAEAEQVGEKVN